MLQLSEYHDQEEPKCTCIDSALQRQALADGHSISENAMFPENIIWLEKQPGYSWRLHGE